jgi:hypothetical protein
MTRVSTDSLMERVRILDEPPLQMFEKNFRIPWEHQWDIDAGNSRTEGGYNNRKLLNLKTPAEAGNDMPSEEEVERVIKPTIDTVLDHPIFQYHEHSLELYDLYEKNFLKENFLTPALLERIFEQFCATWSFDFLDAKDFRSLGV